MRFKHGNQPEQLDENLKGFLWQNTSAQTHVFKSILHETYPTNLFPQMWERYPKIEVKPGKVGVIPHCYYKIFTRDDSPAVGKRLTLNDAIGNFADKTILESDVFTSKHSEPGKK